MSNFRYLGSSVTKPRQNYPNYPQSRYGVSALGSSDSRKPQYPPQNYQRRVSGSTAAREMIPRRPPSTQASAYSPSLYQSGMTSSLYSSAHLAGSSGKRLPSRQYQRDQPLSENPGPLVGLRNLGNTCFMNSILQCLLHTPPLVDFFSSASNVNTNKNKSSKLRGELATNFHQLLMECRRSTRNQAVGPYQVKYLVGRLCPQFTGYSQQDSAEFLRVILEGLHKDLNRVTGKPQYLEMTGDYTRGVQRVANEWWEYSLSRDSSIITDIFQGQQISTITCKNCGTKSLSCDSFLDLSLPIRSSRCTLEDCFELYTRTSKISSYKCEKCKKSGECLQDVSLYRFPQVLVIQLKRFTVNGYRREKLNTDIQLPERLSLNRFAPESQQDGRYRLFGVSHHMGSLGFGHYIADARIGSDWYCFDDSRVSSTRLPSYSSSAYVLFYARD